MIISASRRTDIPAFYSTWFMNRIREKYVYVINPFNAKQISYIDLTPDEVDAIVFWTRNPAKIMRDLGTLDAEGYRYYFQYTITGYPKNIERATPKPAKAINTFSELSQRIGKEKVVWRYDPILLSNLVPLKEHKRVFNKIAMMLQGKTERVVISFADFYKKTERNLKTIKELEYQDITQNSEVALDLAYYIRKIANENGMEVFSCAEEFDLESVGILSGKCIDEQLLNKIFGLDYSSKKDKGQRSVCGCVKSIDIGQYNTCSHQCSYCYATFNNKMVENSKLKHNPESPLLIGELPEDYHPPEKNRKVQSKNTEQLILPTL